MKENKLFDSYVAYELLYEENLGKKYSDISLFPNDWYRITDYQIKIDILLEAINNDLLIIDTNKYKLIK